MCFGIRNWSPFSLNTLNIPIQNIKCPQKSFSSQSLFVKLELCRLCTSMPNPICVTGNAIHESHCNPTINARRRKQRCAEPELYPFFLSVQCFVLGYVIKDESDYRVLLFLLQSMKCAPMCFTYHLSIISELRASD